MVATIKKRRILAAPIVPTLKPTNIIAPIISGAMTVGSKVFCWMGFWKNATRFSYQWAADGVDIAGATSPTYTPVFSDTGKLPSCRVTAYKPGSISTQIVVVAAGVVTATPWTPASLFTGGRLGAFHDLADMSTLFQDSAGTTPVTASGQPLGLIMDKSGNGYHYIQPTAGSRPTYRNDGSTAWVDQAFGDTKFMYAVIPSTNARSSVMIAASYFTDITSQTTSSIMSLGKSDSSVSYIGLGDSSSAWSVTGRNDANTSLTANSADNSADLRNGRILTARSITGSLTVAVDDVVSSSVNGTGVLTVDRIGLLCNYRNSAGGGFAGARFYGGVVMLGTMTDSEILQTQNFFQARMRYWWNIKQFKMIAASSKVPDLAFPFMPAGSGGNYWFMDALGATTVNSGLTTALVTGADLGGSYGTERFSIVSDPLDPTRSAMKFVNAKTDADTGGTNKKRIELSFQNSQLTYGLRYLIGFDIYKGEILAGTSDEATGVLDKTLNFQVHAGEAIDQSPYFAVSDINDNAIIEVRYNRTGSDTGNRVDIQLARLPFTAFRWHRFVVDITPDPSISGVGRLKVWMNGTLVADYTGSIGYVTDNSPTQLGHPKCGIYKPLDAANRNYADSVPVRSVYFREVPMLRSDTAVLTDMNKILDAA